ncbi:MAG TPA: endolytic transglycosylase MltG, partial [Longimicrobiales bacterium]|nr:endolytic transglycosylase MltG [Longimicrobiales bacterium]
MISRKRASLVGAGVAVVLVLLLALASRPGEPVELTIPRGATLSEVADTLEARGVIRARPLFELYARVRGADRKIRAGRYAMAAPSSWAETLRRLTRGAVLTEAVVIPEGFTLAQIAPRLAAVAGVPSDSALAMLRDTALARSLDVPGPGLEGYLFPDTYRFASGLGVRRMAAAMVARYRAVWTPERLAARDALGMTEREVVTLASIVQAEARRTAEMPRIAGVYHNRLDRGWLLQADPTVLYALGGYRARLLFAAIDSVADSPYNTYTQPGLPPGPIGAPGEDAIDAALHPTGDYLYLVAWPDGSHVFTRSLAEHNRARAD